MNCKLFLLAAAGLLCVSVAQYCTEPPYKTRPNFTPAYCNYRLSFKDRVKDLLSRLTLEEKISQLGNSASAIDRLGIPGYQWWSEGLHGVAVSPGLHLGGNLTCTTSFPQIITTASSFNKSLFYEIGEAVSTEARGFADNGQGGLTYFTPNINIVRDPRWGRGQETAGEDPYLTSQYAVNLVRGAQGNDSEYKKIIATCKHFAAYDLESYINGDVRDSFNAEVTKQDLEETYFPAFRSCVTAGGVGSIMCSYNSVNGVPSCVDGVFNNKIARNKWKFDGYLVSDCGAIDDVMNKHHYTSTPTDTVAAGLKGGTDLNCGSFYQTHAMDAFLNGSITEVDIDRAVGRLFTARMRLGLFDLPKYQPYSYFNTDVVNTKQHQDLALQAARESIVLLQNNGKLPLSYEDHHKIAVVGPNILANVTMQGISQVIAPYLISPVDGFKSKGLHVTYSLGCDVKCIVTDGFHDAFKLVKDAKAVVAVMGLDQGIERETVDREDIFLPGLQDKFLLGLRDTLTNLQSPVPLIVVIMSGSSVDLSESKSLADAILWVGYPGQSGGQAIAEVIYGEVNPSGRLPLTFYPGEYIDLVAYRHMSMREPPGRTYRFYTENPVFPFGHGLSYTTFELSWTNKMNNVTEIVISDSVDINIDFDITVVNTGYLSGAVSVLGYVSSNIPDAPLRELFDFDKVFIDKYESKKISLFATNDAFTTVDEKGRRNILPGEYDIAIENLSHKIIIKNN
ncbi:PREDICTED: probable beta-D-xylosidase 2 [Amphimedon queenslandica]|uniref:Fibronectin type III-like domain-containing protein n=1 Tax=Amphimedon queenslandica TaxID=400682 RepID=A0A1X7UQF0_AMPQE|nr:PREDICTED: probable beta-D-xylosidase 2 [Amphimedon queenslandica]|eukprot:XP_003387138.1 PREDICTED: probable beta-D-xylosidase 2 [Amphimedon queenslandica]